MIWQVNRIRRTPRRAWVRYRFALSVLTPVLALFIYLRLLPIGETLTMSTFRWQLVGPPAQFVGLSNYVNLLADPNFNLAFWNTTIFAAGTTVVSVVLALMLAVALTRVVRGRVGALLELCYFLPVLMPMVPVTLGWREIFDYRFGILNSVLGSFGIGPQPWLSDPNFTLVAVIIVSVWKQVGYNMIIFIVGMRAIPAMYYEASAVDGANEWRQLRRITLPLLAPVTLFVLVTTTISSYNVFTQVYVLASDVQGAPGTLVRVLVYDMIENGFRFHRLGYASAEAVYLLITILFLTIIQFRFMGRASQ